MDTLNKITVERKNMEVNSEKNEFIRPRQPGQFTNW